MVVSNEVISALSLLHMVSVCLLVCLYIVSLSSLLVANKCIYRRPSPAVVIELQRWFMCQLCLVISRWQGKVRWSLWYSSDVGHCCR